MAASEYRSGIRSAIATALLLASATLAWAQAGTAGLTGTVRDTQGAVLPGATVTATNPATGRARTTVTNETGIYNLPGLPPGNYTVKVELSGFGAYVRENVILQVDTHHAGGRRARGRRRRRDGDGHRGHADHQHGRRQRRPDDEPRDDFAAAGRGPERRPSPQPAAWRGVHSHEQRRPRRTRDTGRSPVRARTSRT